MFTVLFNVLFKVIGAIANVVLLPINTIVATLLPDFTQLIYHFTTFVNTYITSTLSFFFYLLPPKTKYVIVFYLAYLPIRYLVVLNVHLILKVFHFIKNIKIW